MADLEFQIDGVTYELPSILGLTNRENRIYYKATGLLIEWTWVSLQTGETTFYDLMQNEGFLPAMAHIAYIREHPEADDAEVASMIEGVNRFELFSSLIDSTLGAEDEDERKDDASPLEAKTSGPTESSRSSSDAKRSTKSNKTKSSGKRSTKSSDEQAATPESTGTFESDGRSTSPPLRRVI